MHTTQRCGSLRLNVGPNEPPKTITRKAGNSVSERILVPYGQESNWVDLNQAESREQRAEGRGQRAEGRTLGAEPPPALWRCHSSPETGASASFRTIPLDVVAGVVLLHEEVSEKPLVWDVEFTRMEPISARFAHGR